MRARVVELAGTKRCPTRPNDVGTREAQIALTPQSRPLCSRLTRGQGDAFGVVTKGRGGLSGKSILKPDEPYFYYVRRIKVTAGFIFIIRSK